MEGQNLLYVSVILPIKFEEEIFYTLPEGTGQPAPGTRVRVEFSKREYTGIVRRCLAAGEMPSAYQYARTIKPQESGAYDAAMTARTSDSKTDYTSDSKSDSISDSISDSKSGSKIKDDAQGRRRYGVEEEYPKGRQNGKYDGREDDRRNETQEGSLNRQGLPGSSDGAGHRRIEYKPILAFEERRPVSQQEMRLWEEIARYYMCSVGEVYKAAYPVLTVRQEDVKSRTTPEDVLQRLGKETVSCDIELSEAQKRALGGIRAEIGKRPVLLHGATGSGKTELYITLAAETLSQKKSVLYLVPEIAMSKQLEIRLKEHFGGRLRTFHHAQGNPSKKLLRELLSTGEPLVVLGTRSSIFLPFSNLGLIIVDEEHDSSYKQEDPAPRYNGRDSALFLATIHKSGIILGSATPSLESQFNCRAGKFVKVDLAEKYFKAPPPEIKIVDTIWTRKSRQMRGGFAQQTINEMAATIAEGGQVLVFRGIRSYSPVVQCGECGAVPKCPHCNIPLSYHKYDGTLRCHQCGYRRGFSAECPECHGNTLEPKGAGTERLEEELREIFPQADIARYDADVASNKRASEKVLEEFASGKTNILVGTQMLSKGFDFKGLSLVVVIQADTILSVPDFRADERAVQLFSQLLGRCGRREKKGTLIIQTNQKRHPVILRIASGADGCSDHSHDNGGQSAVKEAAQPTLSAQSTQSAYPAHSAQPVQQIESTQSSQPVLAADSALMDERGEYLFPPFVRMVNIILHHPNMRTLRGLADDAVKVLKFSKSMRGIEIAGPFTPNIERVRNEYRMCVSVKFARDRRLAANKGAMKTALKALNSERHITIDVDPY